MLSQNLFNLLVNVKVGIDPAKYIIRSSEAHGEGRVVIVVRTPLEEGLVAVVRIQQIKPIEEFPAH